MKNATYKVSLIILFISYIILTCVLTIKENFYLIRKEIKSVLKDEEGDKFVKTRNVFDLVMTDNIVLKYDYIDLYGLTQRMFLKREVSDVNNGSNVIKLNNGNLTYVYPNISTKRWIDQIKLVSDYSKDKNIYMIYAQAPWRIDEDAHLPFYVKDNLPKVNNNFLKELMDNHVNVMDLSKLLDGDSNDWFYKTDHHWKTETAFNAYEIIIKDIASNVDISFDEKNVTDFSKTTYEKIFIGTYGKRVGLFYAGLDDYTLILPTFKTSFTVTNFRNPNSITNRLISNFEGVFTYNEYIDVDKIDREMSTYYTYGEGTKAEVISINNLINSDRKILILKDSFADSIYPFIALNFKEMRVLDIRRYQNIKLKTYIDEFEPDVILFLHTPTSLYDETLVKFEME